MQRAITLQDQYHETALRAVGFIQRFVFPGRFIPSVTAITQAVCRATDLKVVHLEGVGPHDGMRLRDRRRNGHARLPQLRALGDVQSLLSKRRRRRAMIAGLTP